MRTLSDRYNTLQSATVAAERIFEVLDEPLDIVDAPDARPLPRIHGEVTFDHVTFGYTEAPVIHDLCLQVPAGTTVETTYTFGRPGTVLLGCHVPGHYAYGMIGSVRVSRR